MLLKGVLVIQEYGYVMYMVPRTRILPRQNKDEQKRVYAVGYTA